MPSEYSDKTANAQADLNLRCTHMSEGTFSDVEYHIISEPCRRSILQIYSGSSVKTKSSKLNHK